MDGAFVRNIMPFTIPKELLLRNEKNLMFPKTFGCMLTALGDRIPVGYGLKEKMPKDTERLKLKIDTHLFIVMLGK